MTRAGQEGEKINAKEQGRRKSNRRATKGAMWNAK
jgi:hypothetical protein